MDKIEKALQKFSVQERKAIKEILTFIYSGKTSLLNLKKLKGRNDIYRVRKGNIRLIYRTNKSSDIFVLSIARRSDNTYKF